MVEGGGGEMKFGMRIGVLARLMPIFLNFC